MLVLIFVINVRLPPKASDFRQRRQLPLSMAEPTDLHGVCRTGARFVRRAAIRHRTSLQEPAQGEAADHVRVRPFTAPQTWPRRERRSGSGGCAPPHRQPCGGPTVSNQTALILAQSWLGYWASADADNNISPGQPRTFRFKVTAKLW